MAVYARAIIIIKGEAVKLTWNQDCVYWFVTDMDEGDYLNLKEECMQPEYYDNTEDGDVYIYNRWCPIGVLIYTCKKLGVSLEIIY